MFAWFHPECPVAVEDQHWLEWRMTWLSEQFGLDLLRDYAVILPTEEFFPQAYDATTEGVRKLLDQICDYMSVDPSRVDLDFYSQRKPIAFNTDLIDPQSGAAGIYDDSTGRTTIWLEVANLEDPENVVATLAHELGHVHLLGDGRLSGAEPDHEPLTDLLTVYFGLGLFTANTVIRDSNWREGAWEGWSVARQGYLTAPLYGYALALFAWYRGEPSPAWARHLRPDVRSPLKKGLRYLDALRSPTKPCRHEGPERPPGAFPPGEASPEVELFSSDMDNRTAEEESGGSQDRESADAFVARGVILANQGDFDAAILEYTSAIELDPADGETYLFRGQAYFSQNQFREALADADRAIHIDPDESDAYRLRGMASLSTNAYERAIQDFTEVLSAEPRDADVLYHRGLAYSARGDLTKAIADFSKAIRSAPQMADVYEARAEAYERTGQGENAAADRKEHEFRASRLKLN